MRRILASLILLIPASASACPFCAGGPDGVNEVKSTIFGSGFGMNLLAAVLPFAIVIGLAIVIHGPSSKPVADQGAADGNAG